MDKEALWGAPVYVYDGTNGDAMIKALGLVEGDAIIALPGKPIIMKAQEWAEARKTWTANKGVTRG